PEEIVYNIEKDSNGVVHPVIIVKICKPVDAMQCSQIVELPDVAGLPQRTSIILPPSHTNDADTAGDIIDDGKIYVGHSSESMSKSKLLTPSAIWTTHSHTLAAASESSKVPNSNIHIETTIIEDIEETKVTLRLQTDQMFFAQLIQYIERTHEFEREYTKQYNYNVSTLGNELTAVTSPFKHDFQIWREIFRLYMEADVWDHTEGDFRPTNTAKEGQGRFSRFTSHIDSLGLANKFRDPLSAKLLINFYELNSELTYLKMLQEMNDLAMRKILKKHDKRTNLISKAQFPRMVTIDTTTLTKALLFTFHTELVGIVPQIDDYLCPMCLNIAWRPLRLHCGHVFCSRCVVKASRRCIFDCPVCRAKDAIYKAGVTNIDKALLNFLKLYFPQEVKEKQRDIQHEISHDETRVVLAVQTRDRPCVIM
ncbi:hypothetical protein GGF37_003640, partial [Kickxella alabastrina]